MNEIILRVFNAFNDISLVGGAVRDIYMNATPKDYDFITTLPLTEIEDIAKKNNFGYYPIGISFGIVKLIVSGVEVEIATVEDSLTKNLSRRDFTMNAMLMNRDGEIYDPFGGRADIHNRVIKTVGNPYQRFKEDGLRLFRAGRFSAQLNFCLDGDLINAASNSSSMIAYVSSERIMAEIERTLLSDNPVSGFDFFHEIGILDKTCVRQINGATINIPILPEISHLKHLKQNYRYHYLDVWKHTFKLLESLPKDIILRWAGLFHDIGKGLEGIRAFNADGQPSDIGHEKESEKIAKGFFERFNYSKQKTKLICWLVKNHMRLPIENEKQFVKWFLNEANYFNNKEELSNAFNNLVILKKADFYASVEGDQDTGLESFEKIGNETLEKYPFYHKDIQINGKDIEKVVGKGKVVSEVLDYLQHQIIYNGLQNSQDSLLEKLINKYGMRDG